VQELAHQQRQRRRVDQAHHRDDADGQDPQVLGLGGQPHRVGHDQPDDEHRLQRRQQPVGPGQQRVGQQQLRDDHGSHHDGRRPSRLAADGFADGAGVAQSQPRFLKPTYKPPVSASSTMTDV
jgi:hypothetical protein